MPDDNFYDLQDNWKVEIDEMLIEIREKEKVGLTKMFKHPDSKDKIVLFVGLRNLFVGLRN